MIREVIIKVDEKAKISGHNVQVTEPQVLKFLTNKFGKIDVISSFSEIGNMIKILFVAQGHTSTYTTETKYIINNTDF